jgi:hypothetical protein
MMSQETPLYAAEAVGERQLSTSAPSMPSRNSLVGWLR